MSSLKATGKCMHMPQRIEPGTKNYAVLYIDGTRSPFKICAECLEHLQQGGTIVVRRRDGAHRYAWAATKGRLPFLRLNSVDPEEYISEEITESIENE